MRYRYFIALLSASSLSWSASVEVASAQRCATDDDCHPGQECRVDGSDSYCERAACQTDDDCPTNFACELGPVAGIPCAGSGCPEPPEPEGECKPQQLPCETDADCPEGLDCVEDDDDDQACAVSIDGEVQCEPEDDEPARACAFVPVICERDADCGRPGFACTVIDESRECDGGDARPTCAPGSECPAPEPEPEPEPEECEVRAIRICFPERMDCADDGDCDGDWSCVPLDDDDDLPPGFEDATALCVPEGIALLASEQIDTPDVDVDGLGSRGNDAPSSTAESGALGSAAQSKQRSAEKGDDGGLCSVQRVGRGGDGARSLLAIAAAGFAVLWRRRRSSCQRA